MTILPETITKLRNWQAELDLVKQEGFLSPIVQSGFIARAEQIMEENDAVVEAMSIIGVQE